MGLLDMIIVAVVAFFAVKGLIRGLVNEVAALAGLIVGSWLAYRFYPLLASPISTRFHIPVHIAAFLAFMLLLLLIGIVAHILGNVITMALRVVMLGSINRLGGLLVGTAEGVVILSLLLSIGTASFMPVQLKEKIQTSGPASLLAGAGDTMLALWRSRSGAQK